MKVSEIPQSAPRGCRGCLAGAYLFRKTKQTGKLKKTKANRQTSKTPSYPPPPPSPGYLYCIPGFPIFVIFIRLETFFIMQSCHSSSRKSPAADMQAQRLQSCPYLISPGTRCQCQGWLEECKPERTLPELNGTSSGIHFERSMFPRSLCLRNSCHSFADWFSTAAAPTLGNCLAPCAKLPSA